MSETVHLIIQNGKDTGRKVSVSSGGIRVGRAEKNDLMVDDEAMSRHHCRFSFREGSLWVTDLGSANRCLVNGQGVDEVQLHLQDVVTVGSTEFRVVCETLAAVGEEPTVGGVVDLGLSATEPTKSEPAKRQTAAWALVGVVAVSALVVAVMAPRLMKRGAPASLASQPVSIVPLEAVYEKVLGSGSNIFFYRVAIATSGTITVQIDDLASKRHAIQDKKIEAPDVLKALSQRLIDTGFSTLDEEYRGIKADVESRQDLTITAGRRTHRTRVINRDAPDAFAKAASMLEEFGKNELGLWATDIPSDRLVEMAEAAYQLGRQLYDEREVKHDNLAHALKSYEEASWYLQTVEPKPDYYQDVVKGLQTLKDELQAQYEEANFRVERAMRLREWDTAQRELQAVCEMIPDTADPRQIEAREKLLDVEKHLRAKK